MSVLGHPVCGTSNLITDSDSAPSNWYVYQIDIEIVSPKLVMQISFSQILEMFFFSSDFVTILCQF